jgi:Fe-S-cluster containining protein
MLKSPRAADDVALPQLDLRAVKNSRTQGGCPFQADNLCAIHTIKPLACRIYFCDRTAQTWQQELLERLLASLRALHDRHAIPYRYMEWRAALTMLVKE